MCKRSKVSGQFCTHCILSAAVCCFEMHSICSWCYVCDFAGQETIRKESVAVECEDQNINIAIGYCSAVPGVAPVNPPPHVREVQSKLARFGSVHIVVTVFLQKKAVG